MNKTTNKISNKVFNYLKNVDSYRYFLSVLFILMLIIHSIDFSNAGTNYDQAINFRPMCIDIGLLVLVNLDIKKWINIPSLVTVVISYIYLHFGYIKQWIPDLCKYEHVDVIRMGKIIGVIWSVVTVSIIIDIIKNKAWKNIRKFNPYMLGIFGIYIILLAIFGHKYAEQNFLIFELIALLYVFSDLSKRKLLMRALKDAVLLSFAYMIYKCLRHRPYDTERYQLYFGNSNMAGVYIAVVVIDIFVIIADVWEGLWNKKFKFVTLVVLYFLIGVACSLTLFNYTRTTIAGLGFAFVTALIVELIKNKQKSSVWLRYLLVIGATIVTFYITFLAIRYIPAYIDEPTLFINEYGDESKIVQGEDINSKKYTTMGSYLRIVFGKWGILIDFEAMENGTEAEATVIDGRDVTNGRTDVWKRFIPQFNLTGHYPRYLYDDEGNIIPHAHNSYLQITYEDGIITGLVYLVMIVSLYILGIIYTLKKEDNNNELLFSLLMIGCMMISLCLEWISRPQYSMYTIGLFLIIRIISEQKNENK